MQLLVGVQVLNGVLLPIILVFILLLINDKNLTKELKNTRANNVLAVGTLILITTAVVVMLGGQVLEWLIKKGRYRKNDCVTQFSVGRGASPPRWAPAPCCWKRGGGKKGGRGGGLALNFTEGNAPTFALPVLSVPL